MWKYFFFQEFYHFVLGSFISPNLQDKNFLWVPSFASFIESQKHYFRHSHRKRKDVFETWAVYIEISGPKTPGINFKKHGNLWRRPGTLRLFMLLWIKQRMIYLKLLRIGTGNEFSCNRRILFQKDSTYKCQFCTKVYLQGWSLKVWVKYKNDPTKMLKEQTHVNKLIDLCLKSTTTLAKEWWMYINSGNDIISFQIRSCCFQLWILFLLALKSTTQSATM